MNQLSVLPDPLEPPDEPVLRNYRGTLDSRAWDWTPFNQCFTPTKIRIGDVDGMVERNHHFLFLEGKPDPRVWERIRGQRIAYERLAGRPDCDVLVLYGEPNEPTQFEWVGSRSVQDGDLERVLVEVRKWFEAVNGQ
jgi:hypothetical protein